MSEESGIRDQGKGIGDRGYAPPIHRLSSAVRRLSSLVRRYEVPLAIWLGARVGLSLLAFVAGLFLPSLPPGGTAPYPAPVLPVVWDRLLGVWAHWDGLWYLQIATAGFAPHNGTTGFLPLYPWLVGALGFLLGGRVLWAGVVLSSAAFLAALVLLWDLVRGDDGAGDGAADRSVLYLTLFPTAFFFWAVYGEGLFLLLAAGRFAAARRGRGWLAAACRAGALLTRPLGVALVLPLVWEMAIAARGSRHPAAAAETAPAPSFRLRDVLTWSLPAGAIAGLLGWAGLTLGNPLAYLTSQADWNRSFRLPWETVVSAWQEAQATPFAFQVESQSWAYLVTLALFAVLAIAGWWVLRGPLALYLTLGVLFPLISGTPHNPLLSYSRQVIVLFPAFIVLAHAGRRRPVHAVIAIASALLLALFLIRFANWYWVA